MGAAKNEQSMDRRGFMKTSAAAAVAGSALLRSAPANARADDGLDHRNERPDIMRYRRLGRTNLMASRLVFGCGSALAGGRAVRLLEVAFEAGINVYDVGSNDYYRNSENHLAPFAKKHRGEIFVASKGYARSTVELKPGEGINTEFARTSAAYWSNLVDKSLKDLDVDFIDAYYTQGADNAELVKSEEFGNAFEKVKKAGKVMHIGVSTHNNIEAVLNSAMETGWYDLTMVAMTPAGWYDRKNNTLQDGSPPLKALRPVLDRVKASGMGLVGMKIGRHLSIKLDLAEFDKYYGGKLLNAKLSPFQRSYAFVLENGVDAVNADMQNLTHFEENLYAARTSHEYFA